jgi:hypothetical protein
VCESSSISPFLIPGPRVVALIAPFPCLLLRKADEIFVRQATVSYGASDDSRAF